jgi:hypothetical protein
MSNAEGKATSKIPKRTRQESPFAGYVVQSPFSIVRMSTPAPDSSLGGIIITTTPSHGGKATMEKY